MNVRTVIALVALLSLAQAQILSPSYIQPPQFNFCPQQQQCCDANTITVDGSATIQATPDVAYLNAQLSVNAKTAALAIQQLANQVARVIAILKNNGLSSDNYESTSVNVYPNTSWVNGVSTVLGQIASESFKITIPTVSADGSNLGKLIDDLACVNSIILNGLSFDVANKTALFAKARGKAFTDAQNKAKDYASALLLSVGQLVTVRDSYSSAPVVNNQGPLMLTSSSNSLTATTVNVGTVPISYFVEIVFAFF